jgi:hypothetical protein
MKRVACLVLSLLLAAISPARPVAAQGSACGDTTPVILFPPTHQMVQYDLGAVTGVDDATTLIIRIISDEPVGREGFDAVIASPTTFQVRAERDGNGDGRVYRIEYLVGGTTGCILTVMVPHNPNRLAIDSGEHSCVGIC